MPAAHTTIPDDPLKIAVVDQTSARADLAKRSELKYALTGVDVGTLRSHLSGNCRQLIHNNRVSTVRSIYFDDARLSACQANLDGVSSRRKLRIRWYDTLNPQRDFFFEVKWRENRVTGKHRLQMRSPQPLHEVTYSQLERRLEQCLPEAYRCQMVRFPDPVMIVEYHREHFASDNGVLRVTLDYDLTFYDQMGRPSISTDFPHRLDDLVVIEGKVPVGRDADLQRLLYPFVPRANRCSKYVHGCRLLGHIRRAE